MQRDLAWEGCVNVRDLGGLPTPLGTTAFGVFVRADNARNLTQDGWCAAAEYGVATVLDLRSEPECAADPPAQPEFDHRRLSLFEHFDGDAAYRADVFARIEKLDVTERHRLLYREALELDSARFAEAAGVLADADGAVLFHCVGGKDRTGLLAALLLRLVDVPIEAIDADYVLSEARLRPRDGLSPNARSAPRDVVGPVLDELEARYGSVAAYLVQAGASAKQVDRIRRGLTPRSGV